MPSITVTGLDVNTTITLDTAPTTEGKINWTLIINPVDISKHCSWLRQKLDVIDSLNEKEEKIPIALDILNYLSTDALEFTKHHPRFKAAVIKKCYEFKLGHPDIHCIIDASNRLLTVLGEQLAVSDVVIKELKCESCDKFHSPSASSVVHTVAPRYKPFDSDFALFILIAKRLKCDRIVNNPDIYFKQFTSAINRGFGLGTTKAEKMEMYITGCKWEKKTDEEDRIHTMRRIFIKHKLIYTEDVMPLYNEWLPTYRIFLGRANRYQKMTRFAENHKGLFSTQ